MKLAIHKSKCGFCPFPNNKNQIEQLIKAVGFFFSSKINQNTCITNGTVIAWSRKTVCSSFSFNFNIIRTITWMVIFH